MVRLGLGVLAVGGVWLELSLVRLLSALYFYNHVYLVLSLAVLGLGLGAALATRFARLRQTKHVGFYALLAALATLLLAALTLYAATTPWRLLPLALAVLPHLFAGLALATLFGDAPEEGSSRYAADLAGAGLGAAAAVLVLDLFGGLGGVFASAVAFALAGLLFARPRPGFVSATVGVVVAAISLGLTLDLPLEQLATPKPLRDQLRAGAKLVDHRWDAFARTDLVYRPDQDVYYLYVDGGAGSLIPDATDATVWRRDIGGFPFAAARPDSALLIGPGGGLDLALAKANGVRDITAVEINRASVTLTKTLDDVTGGVYDGVTLFVDEGRSVLRRLDRPFDLIFLSQVVTQSAELRGYALSENSLYTVQAFGDYLDHLAPGGQIALKLYDELTLTRAMTTVMTTLTERGSTEPDAARHLLALLDTRSDPPAPLLLIRDAPLVRDEAIRLARLAEARGFALLFVPGLFGPPALEGIVSGDATLADLIGADPSLDLRPTDDARPFFYQFERGIPRALRPLLVTLGIIVILGLLALTRHQRQQPHPQPGVWIAVSALGVGFMTLEVALLQQLKLFLGHPTLTLSVGLGALLVAGGLGSALAGRFRDPRRGVAVAALLVLLATAAWHLGWPVLSELTRSWEIAGRVAVAAFALTPVALPLGMPFALLLRYLGRADPTSAQDASAQGVAEQIALAWAVNGVATVVGSVAATVLAVRFGFPAVMGVAALSYTVVLLWAFRPVRRRDTFARATKAPT
ncbi:MAG: hypothetical protein U5L04_08210 [Trueperaceae bacterium]|nr:hypothetical protein [Trueperaceae bacterium]